MTYQEKQNLYDKTVTELTLKDHEKKIQELQDAVIALSLKIARPMEYETLKKLSTERMN